MLYPLFFSTDIVISTKAQIYVHFVLSYGFWICYQTEFTEVTLDMVYKLL
jgi:hypothetical protein